MKLLQGYSFKVDQMKSNDIANFTFHASLVCFQLLVSIMFVLLEWCMRVPLSMLLEAPGGSKSLIYKTFKVRTHGPLLLLIGRAQH